MTYTTSRRCSRAACSRAAGAGAGTAVNWGHHAAGRRAGGRDGYRYTGLATDTRAGQHAWLDARHRAHARVEDRIRTGRDTGLGRLPSRAFAINAA
jgi:hypothetical protein